MREESDVNALVHIVSVTTMLAIASAGLAHAVGAVRVRDRAAALAAFGVALLLALPALPALVAGCSDHAPVRRSAGPSAPGVTVVALALLGHAALGAEILRRRRRGDGPNRDADRVRARVRTRVPLLPTSEDES